MMAIFNYKKDVIKYKTFFFSDDEMKNDYQKKESFNLKCYLESSFIPVYKTSK